MGTIEPMTFASRATPLAAGLAVLVAVSACGSPSTEPATSTPRPTATAKPTPTPKPLPPDTESVTVVGTGVGTWQLVTIPVAVVRNEATRHGVTNVVVHFATFGAGGAPLEQLNSVAVDIPPGAAIPVTADCTDACNNAVSVTATLSGAKWVESRGIGFAAAAVTYSCGGCGGHTDGNVTATLTSSIPVPLNSAVVLFAECVDGGGGIVGGGSGQIVWPGGTSTPVNVSVIVNTAPAGCTVAASTGW